MPQDVNQSGERVIPGSRRPDGTYRKDVRVKAGYVPQEEQQIYQSRGALARQGVPKVPGLDDGEVEAAKAASKSKSAKKNEKRKQKKTEGSAATSSSVSAVAAQLHSTRITSSEDDSRFGTPEGDGAAAPDTAEAALSPVEKRIRATRKKLKQAEVLIAKRDAGEALTAPEKEKVQRAPAWRVEIQELEEQL